MINPFSIEDKLILITGASSGIGRKTAQVLSKQGATIILVGRDENRLHETLSIMENRERHIIEKFDLTRTDEIPSWIKQVVSKTGKPLNGLIHCAGLHDTIPLRVISHKNMNEIMSINLYSGLSLMRGCFNKKIFAEGGSLVFISSVVGLIGQRGVVAYSASKGAIVSAVKSAALEFSDRAIRVNCICPGIVETEMADQIFSEVSSEQRSNIENYHPLGLGRAEDVAFAASYLISDASRWVTGTSLVVDGGYTCH